MRGIVAIADVPEEIDFQNAPLSGCFSISPITSGYLWPPAVIQAIGALPKKRAPDARPGMAPRLACRHASTRMASLPTCNKTVRPTSRLTATRRSAAERVNVARRDDARRSRWIWARPSGGMRPDSARRARAHSLLGELDARTQRPARIEPRLDRGRTRTQRDRQGGRHSATTVRGSNATMRSPFTDGRGNVGSAPQVGGGQGLGLSPQLEPGHLASACIARWNR
jgi:hypothetical protein